MPMGSPGVSRIVVTPAAIMFSIQVVWPGTSTSEVPAQAWNGTPSCVGLGLRRVAHRHEEGVDLGLGDEARRWPPATEPMVLPALRLSDRGRCAERQEPRRAEGDDPTPVDATPSLTWT